jgi:hypothetical protein
MTIRNGEKDVEQLEGKFICGWAEFLPETKEPKLDRKGRVMRYRLLPAKIVTRLMVELPDGSCVPIQGDHFETMQTEIRGAFKAAFPGKLQETAEVASKAYKKGTKVKVQKITFKDDGRTIYKEVE